MIVQRIISIVVLVAFTLVTGAAAVHVHEDHATQKTTLTSASDDTPGSSDCGFCHVVKERATTTQHHTVVYQTAALTVQHPVVANLVSDQCPLQVAGRAPPVR